MSVRGAIMDDRYLADVTASWPRPLLMDSMTIKPEGFRVPSREPLRWINAAAGLRGNIDLVWRLPGEWETFHEQRPKSPPPRSVAVRP